MTRPAKIVCVGRNYVDHAKELGNEMPSEPLLFLKPTSSIIAAGQPIRLPAVSKRVEFEGEIGVVIGNPLCDASEEEAKAAIRGVVAANDVTARDLQKSDSQWTRGKGFDTFCPVGNEIPAPAGLQGLTVVTRVNGEERQRGRVAEMAFSIPMILAYISRVMTLEPGDLVLTGTPAGVGKLVAGDEVEVEVTGSPDVQGSPTASSRVRNPVQDR
ncbi:MAG: fumarylacetoacetate hydrolase family protein [Gemmatimonadaceae bacterium]|nr:fumarylacetoacetate hydrolase family protein [Gemmatimonadaceae bacterium]